MTAPSDLHTVLVDAVRQRLTRGDWQIVAVTPAAVLSAPLVRALERTFGLLRDPVLVVIERVAAVAETEGRP